MTTEYTLEEVKQHNTKASGVWIVLHGNVYDVTKFLAEHPGGDDTLLEVAGRDATADFVSVCHSKEADKILVGLKIGIIKK